MGAVLDRYRVVPVMVADAFAKTVVVVARDRRGDGGRRGSCRRPSLAALYLGLAWMVGGAGLPTLIAGAVPPGGHPRANLFDSLAWSSTAFVGPIVAGLLIEAVQPARRRSAPGRACALVYGAAAAGRRRAT